MEKIRHKTIIKAKNNFLSLKELIDNPPSDAYFGTPVLYHIYQKKKTVLTKHGWMTL